jgi:hypothetical protein
MASSARGAAPNFSLLTEVRPGNMDAREQIEVPIQVMLDGPYGGCNVDLGDYETVLLFAGGSGITFTLGLLDDIVGRCVRNRRKTGERTKRIEFAWCIKSFGNHIPPVSFQISYGRFRSD